MCEKFRFFIFSLGNSIYIFKRLCFILLAEDCWSKLFPFYLNWQFKFSITQEGRLLYLKRDWYLFYQLCAFIYCLFLSLYFSKCKLPINPTWCSKFLLTISSTKNTLYYSISLLDWLFWLSNLILYFSFTDLTLDTTSYVSCMGMILVLIHTQKSSVSAQVTAVFGISMIQFKHLFSHFIYLNHWLLLI